MLDNLAGKKTHILAFIGAGLALAQAFGVQIPENVLTILAFLGISTLRAGIAKV